MNKNLELREYGNENNINIDGRDIPYQIVDAEAYLFAKNEDWSMQDACEFAENNEDIYLILNQIIALKQSCVLLRNTSYTSHSLTGDLFTLKKRLIKELKEKYNYEFDEDLYESYPKKV